MADLHNVLNPLTDGRTRTQGAAGTQFATKARPNHWGTDLRANVYDTPGDDVHAPCDMTLIAAGIGDGSEYARIPWHSGRFQYWDMGIWGGDRMYLYLGHLYEHVGGTKSRRTVTAGTHVAEMGGSGAGGKDRFIDHLHIGVAQNTTRPTGLLKNGKGWIDPVAWFAKHGVSFNTTPIAAGYGFAGSTNGSPITPKEPTLSAAEVAQINAHTTNEINRALDYIADRTSVNPGEGTSDERRSLARVLGGMEAKLNKVPANVWDHKVAYRDQSRNASRTMPAAEALYNISWGNAKTIDALTAKEA